MAGENGCYALPTVARARDRNAFSSFLLTVTVTLELALYDVCSCPSRTM